MGQAKNRGSFEERLRQTNANNRQAGYKGTIVCADIGDVARGKIDLAATLNTPGTDGVILVGGAYYPYNQETIASTVIITNRDITEGRANIEGIFSGTRSTVPIYKEADYVAEAYIPLDTPEAIVWPKDWDEGRQSAFVTMCYHTGVLEQLVKHGIDIPVKEPA